MTRLLCIIALLCFVWQCNDKADDTQPNTTDPNGGGGGNGNNNCPQLALAAFEQYMQPAIDASCGTGDCHGGEASDAIELLQATEDSDNAIINRAKMLKHRYQGKLLTENGVLFSKIGGGEHGGGNQVEIGHITKQGITTWAEAERKCSNSN